MYPGSEEAEEGGEEGGGVSAEILERVEPEEVPQIQNTFQALYDLGPDFGKRIWTDFFESLLPAKLKFPAYADKTVKSMMFDPTFIGYHQVYKAFFGGKGKAGG